MIVSSNLRFNIARNNEIMNLESYLWHKNILKSSQDDFFLCCGITDFQVWDKQVLIEEKNIWSTPVESC